MYIFLLLFFSRKKTLGKYSLIQIAEGCNFAEFVGVQIRRTKKQAA